MRATYTLVLFLTLISLGLSPARAQDGGPAPKIKADIKPRTIPSCITFTNLGTVNPKLLNSCKSNHTIGVSNYRAGEHILDRVFHLMGGDERPIAFPGDLMTIEWVKGWVNEGGSDGSGLFHFNKVSDGFGQLWTGKNLSPTYYNAISFGIYNKSNVRIGSGEIVIEPGQTDNLYYFFPDDPGFLLLDWARLDPL